MPSEYYSIRVLVRHPTMSAAELTSGMGEASDYSGEPLKGVRSSFWTRVSETPGERRFFSEISEVISWLEGRTDFVGELKRTGGTVEVIVQLAGDRNMGDSWMPEEMLRAAALGVSLGVEVFPKIRGVTGET